MHTHTGDSEKTMHACTEHEVEELVHARGPYSVLNVLKMSHEFSIFMLDDIVNDLL